MYIFFLSFSFVTVEIVAGSAAWLGRGLSCVCVQRRDIDDHPSFDLTPAQVVFCLVGLFVLYFWEHFPVCVALLPVSAVSEVIHELIIQHSSVLVSIYISLLHDRVFFFLNIVYSKGSRIW